MKNGDSIKQIDGTYMSKKVLESEDCKIFWDFPIQTEKILEHNRPYITAIDKKSKKCLLVHLTCKLSAVEV